MPINSRTKGATFEREVAKILNDFFESEGIDYVCKRNLDQYQSKDSEPYIHFGKDELECLSSHPLGFDREEMGLVNNYKKDK